MLKRSLNSTQGDTTDGYDDDEYVSDKTDIFSNALKEKVSTVLYQAKKETSEIIHSVTKFITKFELQLYKKPIFDTSPPKSCDGEGADNIFGTISGGGGQAYEDKVDSSLLTPSNDIDNTENADRNDAKSAEVSDTDFEAVCYSCFSSYKF